MVKLVNSNGSMNKLEEEMNEFLSEPEDESIATDNGSTLAAGCLISIAAAIVCSFLGFCVGLVFTTFLKAVGIAGISGFAAMTIFLVITGCMLKEDPNEDSN